MKPVSELLRQGQTTLRTVEPGASVFDALKRLSEYEIGALVVMDGGSMVGVMSERDYTRKVALQGRSSKETLVAEIMTADVFTVGPATRTRDCMALMREKRIRHLPVVDSTASGGAVRKS